MKTDEIIAEIERRLIIGLSGFNISTEAFRIKKQQILDDAFRDGLLASPFDGSNSPNDSGCIMLPGEIRQLAINTIRYC